MLRFLSFLLLPSLLALQLSYSLQLAMAAPVTEPVPVADGGYDSAAEPRPARTRQLFQFSNKTAIENILVRPNGQLLLSTLNSGYLFSLDPSSLKHSAQAVVDLAPATGLAGMATIDPVKGIYGVCGGEHVSFGFNDMAIYVVKLTEKPKLGGSVIDRIPTTNKTVNGMTNLPAFPHILLAVSSKSGEVLRINTKTRVVDVAIHDPANLGTGTSTFPLGVNGARVRDRYLYFTNSAQGTFGRYPINLATGANIGPAQILATLPGPDPPGMTHAYDDFTFDNAGNAYVALHSYSYVKITPRGDKTIFAGNLNRGYEDLYEPTSAALAPGGKKVYLCTAGMTVNGTVHGGQVLEVDI